MPSFHRLGFLILLFTVLCTHFAFTQVSFTQFPQDYTLIPRNNSNQGIYTINGTLQSNGVEAIRIKIIQEGTGIIDERSKNVQGYGTNFSIDISIPAITRNHEVEFYTISNGQESLMRKASNIVAGDVFIVNGQSNAEANVIIMQEDRNPYQRGINASGNWVELRYANPGHWAGRIAGQITSTYNIPVAIFNFAKGAQSIKYFLPNYSPTYNNNFNAARQTLENLGIADNVRGVFWFQGETDGWQATIESYQNDLNTLKNAWRSTYGLEHIYYYQIRSYSCSHPNPFVLEAQRRAALYDPGLHVMSTSNATHDGCHFTYENGYQDLGDRLFRLLANDLYNGNYSSAEAPDIIQVQKTGSKDLVLTFTNGNSLSKIGNPWADFNLENVGYRPYTGSVTGNKISLKFSQNIPDNASLTYRCHAGEANDHIYNQSGVGILSFYDFIIEDGTSDPCANDNIAPVFSNCPGNIYREINGSAVSIDWTAPTVVDNCSTPNVQSNAVSGQSFLPGSHNVIYTATDDNGNTASCSFTITVVDISGGNNNPDCNNNMLENAALNSSANWTGGYSLVYDPAIGSNVLEVCNTGTLGNARQIQNVSGGQEYHLTVDVQAQASGFINMKFLNASYAPLAQNVENIPTLNNYLNYAVSAIAPAGTAYVEVSVEKQNGSGCLRAMNWCLTNDAIAAPNCSLTSSTSNLQCDDNNSSTSADDEFTFNLNVSGTNSSNSWESIIDGQSISSNYDQAITINGGLINNGNLTFTISDSQDAGCSETITINPPSTCSQAQSPTSGGACSNNLLDNGNFEDGLTDWSLYYNGSLSSNAFSGARSLKIDPFGNRALHNLAITPGQPYNLSAYVKGAGEATIALKFLNAQWSPLQTVRQTLNATNTFQSFEGLNEIAPNNASYVEIALINNSNSSLYFDEVCLENVGGNNGGNNPGSGAELGDVNCNLESEYPWEEWITRVQMGGVTHNSSKSIYSDFSQIIFPAESTNNELTIRTNWSYLTRPMYINAFLDWNGDDIYTEDEFLNTIMSPPASGNNVSKSATLNFDLPANAVNGLHKMRIIASRYPVSDPCSRLEFGEVEDYLININSGLQRQAVDHWSDQLIVYPNPAMHSVYVDYTAFPESEVKVILSNALGQTSYDNFMENDVNNHRLEIRVADLEDGIYFLLIQLDDQKQTGRKIVVSKGL